MLPPGGSLSLHDQFSKRPLPPVPRDSENAQPELKNGGLFTKYANNQNGSSARWCSPTKSRPLPRSGSEPNLLNDAVEERRRLSSSHSLECLNIEEQPQKEKSRSKSAKNSLKDAFMSLPRPRRSRPSPESSNPEPPFPCAAGTVSSADGQNFVVPPRPPPPAQQSAEEIVNNFLAMKQRNSIIRRQRPVSPGMRRRSGVSRRSMQVDTTSGISESAEDNHPTLMVRFLMLSIFVE